MAAFATTVTSERDIPCRNYCLVSSGVGSSPLLCGPINVMFNMLILITMNNHGTKCTIDIMFKISMNSFQMNKLISQCNKQQFIYSTSNQHSPLAHYVMQTVTGWFILPSPSGIIINALDLFSLSPIALCWCCVVSTATLFI